MIDKIKNFLYDISDMLLSLLIIALIFYAVSWKISDTLSPDTVQNKKEIVKTENQPVKPIENPNPTPETDAPKETDVTENETPKENEVPKESQPQKEADKSAKDDSKETTPSGEMITFTIAPGSSGYAIGKSLMEKGFVENADEFTKRIIELGVDNQLKAGDFKLAKGDALDTVINVLIGKGR